MSKALQDKIRAIMESSTEAKPSDKKAAKEVAQDAGNEASANAKEVAAKNKGKLPTANGDFESELPTATGTFKPGSKDKATVKEAELPDSEKDYKGDRQSGESGNSKTDKIRANQDNKLGKPEKLADEVHGRADKQDDNGDNKRGKLEPGAAEQQKGGKLTSPQHEDFAALFDGQELTEEFKSKAQVMFEAAVAYQVEQRVEELQEEFQQQVSEAVGEVKAELSEQIDGYLDYVVEQWLQDNAVALESGMKVELVGSFIDGLKQVFQEHYVDVPEDKVNVVEEQAQQIGELQEEVKALQEEKAKAVADKLVLQCEEILADKAKGLTAIEEDKFRSLAENVEFKTVEEFELKAQTIREQFFKKPSQETKQEQVTESHSKPSSMAAAVKAALDKGNLNFIR